MTQNIDLISICITHTKRIIYEKVGYLTPALALESILLRASMTIMERICERGKQAVEIQADIHFLHLVPKPLKEIEEELLVDMVVGFVRIQLANNIRITIFQPTSRHSFDIRTKPRIFLHL